MRKPFALIATLLLAACASGPAGQSSAAKGTYAGFLVVSSEPDAADAGAKILREGGTAVDAAVAVQTVLGLVEPGSSGLGGGAFLLYRDGKTGTITSYDGRETAPAATKPTQFLDADGKPGPSQMFGGESIGVPGVMPMLAMAHKAHGRLPWNSLFEPAIDLAEDGFTVDRHLNEILTFSQDMKDWPGIGTYLYDKDGKPLAVGTKITNPDYAKTLQALAANPRALNEGPHAENIVRAVANAKENPQVMTLADLSAYRAKERAPVCGPYRTYIICGMGPPSSGGITVLQILTMLEGFPLPELGPENPESWHLIAEAEKLAFADRARWIADADLVDVPVKGLTDRTYLQARAALIDKTHASKGRREAGTPPQQTALYAPSQPHERPSTSHFTIIDKDGNVVAMTTSIQLTFGSKVFVDGYLLNNELTDFASVPEVNGVRVANAAAPGKRPLSSMSPTIVLDKNGKLVMAIGSPGGIRIISYVTKALIASLDWNMPLQEAVDLPNFVNLNTRTEIEENTGSDALKSALEAMGHEVAYVPMRSALQGFRVVEGGYEGATDRHRDGKIAGETPVSKPWWKSLTP